MKRFQISANNSEEQAWIEFNATGAFELNYGNGMVDTFDKLIFGWEAQDFSINDTEWGFYAGYADTQDTLSDSFNVPAHVFHALFPSDKAYWNAAESYHTFTVGRGETLAECMARVANTLSAAGFIWSPEED